MKHPNTTAIFIWKENGISPDSAGRSAITTILKDRAKLEEQL
jgi:hypothetical protein